ncbi:helix-turn-helix domain-containing protein [Bacillus cereus]|uniref:Excisionase n=1 Tax=Bacillus cereus TaxID=1396 RepID=A0A2B9DP85_BACCE|nr:helix-turn-helix domain-containing protein [Bacillus cereus]PGM89624.1 excisionase [Bacillus cereus]
MSQDVWFLTKPTVTTKEAAEMLRVTVQTVLKKEKEGLIQCVYPESWKQFGSKFFYVEDIQALIEEEQVEGFTTKEAADLLNVAPSTIFTYIRSKKLPAKTVEKRGKQVYVIAEEDLEIFQQEHEIKTARQERKSFLTKIQGIEIRLFQLLTHQDTSRQARVIEINGEDGKVMTEEEDIFPLSEYKERGYCVPQYAIKPMITKRGTLSFVFRKPQLFHAVPYRLINLFYEEIGSANIRLALRQDTIHLEVKPCLLQVDPVQWQEELQYLHAHMTAGSFVPHTKGIFLKSNMESLSFHADHAFKQQVIAIAKAKEMGQEEFLYHAVRSYIESKRHNGRKTGLDTLY